MSKCFPQESDPSTALMIQFDLELIRESFDSNPSISIESSYRYARRYYKAHCSLTTDARDWLISRERPAENLQKNGLVTKTKRLMEFDKN